MYTQSIYLCLYRDEQTDDRRVGDETLHLPVTAYGKLEDGDIAAHVCVRIGLINALQKHC